MTIPLIETLNGLEAEADKEKKRAETLIVAEGKADLTLTHTIELRRRTQVPVPSYHATICLECLFP